MSPVVCLYGSGKAIVMYFNGMHVIYNMANTRWSYHLNVMDAINALELVDPRT